MYSKIYFPLLIVILGVLLVLLLVYPIFPVGAPETQVIPGTVEKISEFPVTIKIPSISIDAHVEQVGFGNGGDGHVRFALIENELRTTQAIRNLKKALTKLG